MPQCHCGSNKTMRPRVKKIIIGVLDVILGIYLVLAVTSFNKPKKVNRVCSKVEISVADSSDAGFYRDKAVAAEQGLVSFGEEDGLYKPAEP